VSDKPSGQSEGTGSHEGLSAELEKALREATEAIDTGRGAEPGGSKKTADQVTLEALSDELGNLKAEYEDRMAELGELRDRAVRQQAEFENFRRRSLKEREEAHHFGHQNLVKDLLPTVDNLERAVEHAEGSEGANLEGLLQGVGLVLREFEAALRKHSVQLVEAEGQIFDPAVHEAVGQVPDASLPPNTVAHVLQKGYQLHDRMLRPARVMVTRAPDDGSDGKQD
jgi:molecular chaperone GrpE